MSEDDGPLNILITIISCRDLLPKKLLSRDPFVKVKNGNTTLHKTKCIPKTLNPAFGKEHNYAFILKITRSELLSAGALKFNVQDHTLLSGHGNLGFAMIQADFILEATGAPTEFEITPPDWTSKKGLKEAGFITIECHRAATNEIAYYEGVVPEEVKQARPKKKTVRARPIATKTHKDDPLLGERKKAGVTGDPNTTAPLKDECDVSMNESNVDKHVGMHLIVLVEILSCKGILMGDIVSTDPFVKVKLGKRAIHKTKYLSKTLNPVFTREHNNAFFLRTTADELRLHKGLTFKVKDYDFLTANDDLGHIQVPPKHFLEPKGKTLEFKITPPADRRNIFAGHMKILVRETSEETFAQYDFDDQSSLGASIDSFASFVRKKRNLFMTPKMQRRKLFGGPRKIVVREGDEDASALSVNDLDDQSSLGGSIDSFPSFVRKKRNLFIEIVSARGILMGDAINSSDPYVKVKMGRRDIHKTKYISKTLNPVFTKEQENVFLLQVSPDELRANEGLTFKVKDYDFLSYDDDLGFAQVSAQRLLDAKGEVMEFKITPPKARVNMFAGYLTIRCREAAYGEIVYYGGAVPPGRPGPRRKQEEKVADVADVSFDFDHEKTIGRDSSSRSLATATITNMEDLADGPGGLAEVMEGDEVEEELEPNPEPEPEPEPDYSMYNGDVRLYVQIVSCRNLLKGDGTSSDPYVIVSMDGKELHETKFLSRTINPIYSAETDSIFVLEIYVSDLVVSEGLEFHVKDHASGADLGSVHVTKDTVTSFGSKSKKMKLVPPAGKDGVEAGSITIRCRIEDIVPGASDRLTGGSGAVATGSVRTSLTPEEANSLGEVKMYLQIVSCRGLLKGDGNSSDPFVVMLMGGNELHRTKPIERSVNPVYNASSASIGVVNKMVSEILACNGVEFLVKDASLEGKNDDLGSVKVNANVLGNFGEKSQKMKLVVPEGKKADSAGTITLRCRIEEVTPGAVENLANGLTASALVQASERGVTEAAKADMPELMEESSVDTRSIATDFKSTTGEPRSSRKLVDGTPEGISHSADDVKLYVQIISCRGLIKGNGTSSSPFVTVALAGEEVHRTKHLVETLNPIFNSATNSIGVLPLSTSEILASTGLEFTVKDFGLNGEKDELGSASIPPETVLDFGPKSRKLKLQPPEGKSEPVGFITVRCRLEDIAPVPGETGSALDKSPASHAAASGVAAEIPGAKGQEITELETIVSGQEVEPETVSQNPADDEIAERELEPTVSVSEEEEEDVEQVDVSSSEEDDGDEESEQTSLPSYHTGYESIATARGSYHPSADAEAPEGFGALAYVDTSKEGMAYPTNRVIRHGQIVAVGPNTYIVPWEAAKDRSKPFSTRGHMIIVRKSYESDLILINSVRLSKLGLVDLDKLGRVKDVIRLENHDGIDDRFYQRRYGADVWSSKPKEEEEPSNSESERDSLKPITPNLEEERVPVASVTMEDKENLKAAEEDMEAVVETVLSQGSDLQDLSNVYVLAAGKERENSLSPAGGKMIVVKKPNSEDLIIINGVRLPPDGLEALDSLGQVKFVIRIAGEKTEDDVFYQERYGALVWVKNPQGGHTARKHPVEYVGSTPHLEQEFEEVEEDFDMDMDMDMEMDLDDMMDDDDFESGRVVVEGFNGENLDAGLSSPDVSL